MEYHYNIQMFDYNAKENILFANENNLHADNVQDSFPNGRKQFYVYNRKSNNHRRFRFIKETYDTYVFSSEDNILCKVNKKINLCSAGNFN